MKKDFIRHRHHPENMGLIKEKKSIKRKRNSESGSAQQQTEKKKRVSFSSSFETRIIGRSNEFISNKSIDDEEKVDVIKPVKSILKKTITKERKVLSKPKMKKSSSADTNFIIEAPSPKFSSVTVQKPLKKPKSSIVANNKNAPHGKPRKKVLRVRRSTKEILMNMNKKERREFIQQLEAKNKPNYELVRQAKLLWETIRSSKAPAEEKEECIQKVMELCRGKLSNLVYCHTASRVIQSLLALKKPAIREAIFEELKTEIVRMAKLKYAKHFVVKMLKYGSKEQRNEVISALNGHYTRLLKIADSADLVDTIYGEWATAEQYHSIISEFYGPEFQLLNNEFPPHRARPDIATVFGRYPEKGEAILKNLESMLEVAVQKIPVLKLSITHKLLLDYLTHCSDDQKQLMIDSLKDQLPEICHTREGSRATLICIWHANTKDRKAIVKSFKGLAIRSCQDSFARRALFGIFDSVDDTVLVNQIITQEIANNIADLIYHKNGIWVLHYLVHPRDQRVIGKGLKEMLRSGDEITVGKKEPTLRYSELFQCVQPALLDFMKANMREMITNKVSAVLILDCLEVPSLSDPFKREIAPEDMAACFQAISEIAADEFIPHSIDGPNHIVQSGCSRFVFRKLLQSDPLRAEGTKLSDFLADLPADCLSTWTSMDCGCYTLVEMLKSGSSKAKEALSRALNENSLKKSSLKGAKALLEQLTLGDRDEIVQLPSSAETGIKEPKSNKGINKLREKRLARRKKTNL